KNYTEIAQQGDGNYVAVDIEGDDNFSGIYQLGYYNTVFQQIKGDEYNYKVFQQGNNNLLKMNENSFSSKTIEIKQKGNNMKLEITTRKIF
ncbi:hypothetical protein ACFLRZ_04480, partial [Bacteroidota bacterium]